MTKAELINEIKNRIGFDTDNETYAMSKDERDFYTSILKILEQEPCDDAVSRQEAIHCVTETELYNETFAEAKMRIAELKPVLPKREQGEWIEKVHNFEKCWAECSVCGKTASGHSKDTGWGYTYSYTDYCPNCGAKMVEPQESEEV